MRFLLLARCRWEPAILEQAKQVMVLAMHVAACIVPSLGFAFPTFQCLLNGPTVREMKKNKNGPSSRSSEELPTPAMPQTTIPSSTPTQDKNCFWNVLKTRMPKKQRETSCLWMKALVFRWSTRIRHPPIKTAVKQRHVLLQEDGAGGTAKALHLCFWDVHQLPRLA